MAMIYGRFIYRKKEYAENYKGKYCSIRSFIQGKQALLVLYASLLLVLHYIQNSN